MHPSCHHHRQERKEEHHVPAHTLGIPADLLEHQRQAGRIAPDTYHKGVRRVYYTSTAPPAWLSRLPVTSTTN